jgi:cell division protein ZapA
MSQIVVRVNGRDYPIVCDDGREERIQGIGTYVDEKVREVAAQVGQAGDARLMLLAALNLGDELAAAYDSLEDLRGQPPRTIVDPTLVAAAEAAREDAAIAKAQAAAAENSAQAAFAQSKAADDSRARAEAATQSWIAKAEEMAKRLCDAEARAATAEAQAAAAAARAADVEVELADTRARAEDADSRAIDAQARAGTAEGDLAIARNRIAALETALAEAKASAASRPLPPMRSPRSKRLLRSRPNRRRSIPCSPASKILCVPPRTAPPRKCGLPCRLRKFGRNQQNLSC